MNSRQIYERLETMLTGFNSFHFPKSISAIPSTIRAVASIDMHIQLLVEARKKLYLLLKTLPKTHQLPGSTVGPFAQVLSQMASGLKGSLENLPSGVGAGQDPKEDQPLPSSTVEPLAGALSQLTSGLKGSLQILPSQYGENQKPLAAPSPSKAPSTLAVEGTLPLLTEQLHGTLQNADSRVAEAQHGSADPVQDANKDVHSEPPDYHGFETPSELAKQKNMEPQGPVYAPSTPASNKPKPDLETLEHESIGRSNVGDASKAAIPGHPSLENQIIGRSNVGSTPAKPSHSLDDPSEDPHPELENQSRSNQGQQQQQANPAPAQQKPKDPAKSDPSAQPAAKAPGATPGQAHK